MPRRAPHRPAGNRPPCSRLAFAEIDPADLRRLVNRAKEEDLSGRGLLRTPASSGDVTCAALLHVLGGNGSARSGSARVIAREPLTACGQELVPYVLEAYDPSLAYRKLVEDGSRVEAGAVLGVVEGRICALLSAERVLLNFLQHLSAVATETSAWADALAGSPTRLLDTRKTTPGFRLLEKHAVGVGGGWNHRLGLYDRVMFKDNHLAQLGVGEEGRIAVAVATIQESFPDLLVEVEIDSLDQLDPVLAAGPDIILFDNFDDAALAEGVRRVGDRAWTEASGGIRRARLPALRDLGLTFVSAGAIVHQARWPDIALDW